jgi:hypothetical protein
MAIIGTCKNCQWYRDEVCVNSDSEKCADFVLESYACEKWGPSETSTAPCFECLFHNAYSPKDDDRSIKEWCKDCRENEYDCFTKDSL